MVSRVPLVQVVASNYNTILISRSIGKSYTSTVANSAIKIHQQSSILLSSSSSSSSSMKFFSSSSRLLSSVQVVVAGVSAVAALSSTSTATATATATATSQSFVRSATCAASATLQIVSTGICCRTYTSRTVSTGSKLISTSFIRSSSFPFLITSTSRNKSNMMFSTASFSSTTSTDIDNLINVAMCQFQVTENKDTNIQTASDYIDRAAVFATTTGTTTEDSSNNTNESSLLKKKTNIIVLPEIWNSPYATAAFPDYAEYVPDVQVQGVSEELIDSTVSPSSSFLQAKAIEHSIYIIGGSIPEKKLIQSSSTDNNNNTTTCTYEYYNTCLVFNPYGQIITKHRKVHLFDINVPNGITFRESDTLQPGNTISYFNYNNICNIGVGICYDIRFAEYAMLLQQQYNCSILIYPGAFNMITGPAHWELLQKSRAIDNQCYVITCSPARTIEEKVEEDDVVENNNNSTSSSITKTNTTKKKYPHYTAWGHSTIVGPWGDIISTTNELPTIVYGTIDLSKVTSIRQSIPITIQKRADLYQLTSSTTSTSK